MKCITKIIETTIKEIEDLDLFIPVYSLFQSSSNYSDTASSLWFYAKDEASNCNLVLKILTILSLLSIRLNYCETLELMEQIAS